MWQAVFLLNAAVREGMFGAGYSWVGVSPSFSGALRDSRLGGVNSSVPRLIFFSAEVRVHLRGFVMVLPSQQVSKSVRFQDYVRRLKASAKDTVIANIDNLWNANVSHHGRKRHWVRLQRLATSI